MAFKFEKLVVWQKALESTKGIHDMTKEFPVDERYVLTDQVRRAADSVALNIAEGSTGQSNAEFSRFVGYAIRSAIEVVACLHIGLSRNVINQDSFNDIYNQTEEIVKMLQALRKKLN
ncbi:four helix bundle protein [Tunicatimonas pelagia]|uniref:four helix bundle protein n=1 Tax=Tunicatimonas pelagia TaxID=931531 RepID=UPI0026657ED4|nr:four helix bundle protein [Tunicatimonas pelagia]WKN41362.1 four helix bundle protein [Tunicatimonas pelagia]